MTLYVFVIEVLFIDYAMYNILMPYWRLWRIVISSSHCKSTGRWVELCLTL